MKVDMEHLGAPPLEYDQKYFANTVRALEAALRRVDYAPVFDPDVKRTDDANPSKALYSTGGIKLDEQFVPESAEDIIPKKYVDAIDTALQEALATLDAARQEAEAALGVLVQQAQDDVDAVKDDASLITYDPAGAVLTEVDVQAAIDEAAGDGSTTSGLIYYKKASGVLLSATEVSLAIDELSGNATVSGVASYIKGVAGVPLVATAMNVAIDELAGVTGSTTGNIGVDSGDYNATGTQDLGTVLSEIDGRLTTLEP